MDLKKRQKNPDSRESKTREVQMGGPFGGGGRKKTKRQSELGDHC